MIDIDGGVQKKKNKKYFTSSKESFVDLEGI
jgi:hypothetical protein